MKRLARLIVMVIGLALMLNSTSSGGAADPATCSAPGCNSTVGDANGNTAGGTSALRIVDPGSGGIQNTAFGQGALFDNTAGSANTAIGFAPMGANSTGSKNTAVGASALGSNDTGSDNTVSGYFALYANDTGSGNVASGSNALFNNTIGNNNTAIGSQALQQSTGTKNIGIGYRAGLTLTAGNNNIYLGNQGVSSSESQTMRLGSTQTRTFVAGIGATPIVANAATVEIDTATGQLGVGGGSSARYKQDVTPMGSQSTGLLQLRPVTFAYKEDVRHVTHYGLIAEEVAAVYPELVTHTATGDAMTVRYQELIPMLLNELQKQRQELAELRALVGQTQAHGPRRHADGRGV